MSKAITQEECFDGLNARARNLVAGCGMLHYSGKTESVVDSSTNH